MSPTVNKVLRYSVLSVVILLALLVATAFFIRHRTIGQWNEFKSHWESKGEHFDIEHFIPAPIPDEENLAMHPVFKDLWIEGSESAQRLDSLDTATLQGFNEHMTRTHRQQGQLVDFTEWGDLEQGLNTDQCVTEILRRLESFNADMDLIAEVLKERPLSQFPADWEFTFATETPHLFKSLSLAKAFILRAQLRLQSNDADLAVDDLATIRRLADLAGQEETLVAFLVEIALFHAYLNGVWEGVVEHRFTDAQLRTLDAGLPPENYIAQRCLRSLRFERAAVLQVVDLMDNDPTKIDPTASNKAKWLSSWWANNRIAASQDLQEHIFYPGGTKASRPTLANANRFNTAFEKRKTGLSKYTQALAILAVADYHKAIARTLQLEAELNHARIAIAVERYRLKHNSFPPGLARLVPEFLPALPIDEINHRPIEYRLRSDGTPIIYQWGGDGDDDRATPRHDLLHGDVVWQHPLDPPISHSDYRLLD